MQIYHILPNSDWEQAQANGQYSPPSLELEGFIHTSTRAQLVETANRYYHGQSGLVVLVIAQEQVRPPLRFDPVSRDGVPMEFPHIYGPLNLDAVARVVTLPAGPDGLFTLPAELAQEE